MTLFSAYIYEGPENNFTVVSEYFNDFYCKFELEFYPFDSQVCTMKFEVMGRSQEFVRLSVDDEAYFLGKQCFFEFILQ